jgi:predicted porin
VYVPRKQVLAASIAAACAAPTLAAAQAPFDFQIYGRVNVSYERIRTDQTNWSVEDNSSRIGFRGKKPLGGGVTGLFQVESRAKVDDGTSGVLSSRDSYVGLQHDAFGTGRLGRTIGPVYYATYDYISMHNHDTGTSSDALLAPTVFGNMGFMNNTLWYTSPKLGGAFTVDVAHSRLNEARVATLSGQPSHLGLVGAFDRGPIHVAVSHAQTKDSAALTPGTGNDDRATTVGGAWDLKRFVIGALFERATSDLAGGGDVSRNYCQRSPGPGRQRRRREAVDRGLQLQPDQGVQAVHLLHRGRQRAERQLRLQDQHARPRQQVVRGRRALQLLTPRRRSQRGGAWLSSIQ